MMRALVAGLLCLALGNAASFGSTDDASTEAARPLPPGTARVEKNDRVLLLAVTFVKYGSPKLRWLYKFLEGSSVILAKDMLRSKYRHLYLLGGSNATSSNFVHATALLAQAPDIKAIDTFIHTHGSQGGVIWFNDGGASAAELRPSLAPLGSTGKLRLLYSTACYGAQAAPEFVASGYQAASGAIAVNADSTWAYPVTMLSWRSRHEYGHVVHLANNGPSIAISDGVARLMGFKNVNSRKLLFGDPRARIDAVRAQDE